MHRAVRCAWSAGFLLGAMSHARDIATHGWLPYEFMPLPFNAYWTALLPLDLVAAALVWWRERVAIWLGTAIMASNLAINGWTIWGAGYTQLIGSVMVQAGFASFVFIVAASDRLKVAWPRGPGRLGRGA